MTKPIRRRQLSKARPRSQQRMVVPMTELLELLDHCQALLHAMALENMTPTRDMVICARERASRCAAMIAELKRHNAELCNRASKIQDSK